MISVRWTGAAGLEFTWDGQTILIDPYHSRVGKWEIFFRPLKPSIHAIETYLEGLPGKLTAIIVGHTHFDHALDIAEFSKRFDGPLVGSASLETLMSIHGIPGRVTVCEGVDRLDLAGGATLTMIPSRHGLVAFGRIPYPGEIDPEGRPPLKARQYRHGSVYMPKLEINKTVFMHAGSANFIESQLEGHHCDVLFMCVPGWKKALEYSSRLLDILNPKVIVPFHFDDFSAPFRQDITAPDLPFQDIPGFLKQVSKNAPDAEIKKPQTFETITF
jgi:L-ascorbate metabolism protein UlaG (beta-lactamase superfamily)